MHSWRTILPGCGGFFIAIFLVPRFMVVHEINLADVARFEPEDHAPIRPDGYAPEPFQLALERMEPESRKIHMFRVGSAVQNGKDVFKLVHMIGLNTP